MLDVGIGFGKWGFLAREYLETWNRRVFKSDWKIRVDGVEAWSRYIEAWPWLREIYDNIIIAPVEDVIDELSHYDLIIAGDVIEHLPKETALHVVAGLIERADRMLIISIPVGAGWLGNTVIDGNPYEQHRSEWTTAEVAGLAPKGWGLEYHVLPVGFRNVGLFIFTRG